jgi:hypothetical protein
MSLRNEIDRCIVMSALGTGCTVGIEASAKLAAFIANDMNLPADLRSECNECLGSGKIDDSGYVPDRNGRGWCLLEGSTRCEVCSGLGALYEATQS